MVIKDYSGINKREVIKVVRMKCIVVDLIEIQTKYELYASEVIQDCCNISGKHFVSDVEFWHMFHFRSYGTRILALTDIYWWGQNIQSHLQGFRSGNPDEVYSKRKHFHSHLKKNSWMPFCRCSYTTPGRLFVWIKKFRDYDEWLKRSFHCQISEIEIHHLGTGKRAVSGTQNNYSSKLEHFMIFDRNSANLIWSDGSKEFQGLPVVDLFVEHCFQRETCLLYSPESSSEAKRLYRGALDMIRLMLHSARGRRRIRGQLSARAVNSLSFNRQSLFTERCYEICTCI